MDNTNTRRAFHRALRLAWLLAAVALCQRLAGQEKSPPRPLRLDPPHIASDKMVKYDYDIVYVRLLRDGPKPKVWAQAGVPLQMNPGADLMLLRPDGSEEVLVAGGKGSVTDPFVSFDGEWVYYSYFHDLTKFQHGFAPSTADIYKIHVPTRKVVRLKGQPVANKQQSRKRSVIGYVGSVMPPPEAVAGTYVGPEGQKIKVSPLSDEDRRTIVRWIDLGCPLDLDYDPASPDERGYGWMQDDNRPTLTLTYPNAGAHASLTRILVGMHDYDTGLDMDSFQVVADFPVDSVAAGENLASKFTAKASGVWELILSKPLMELPAGTLKISVKDRQGNVTRIDRKFSIAAKPSR